MHTYITYIHTYVRTYVCMYGLVFRVPTPPNGMGPQVAPPSLLFGSYWRISEVHPRLVFARPLQHLRLPTLHLLGTCYLLGDLRSTHTPSKYLRATYSRIYMCYVSTPNLVPCMHYFGIHTTHTIPPTHTIPDIQTIHTTQFKHTIPTTHTIQTIHALPTIHSNDTIATRHIIETIVP